MYNIYDVSLKLENNGKRKKTNPLYKKLKDFLSNVQTRVGKIYINRYKSELCWTNRKRVSEYGHMLNANWYKYIDNWTKIAIIKDDNNFKIIASEYLNTSNDKMDNIESKLLPAIQIDLKTKNAKCHIYNWDGDNEVVNLDKKRKISWHPLTDNEMKILNSLENEIIDFIK